jgi:hypothetical protein
VYEIHQLSDQAPQPDAGPNRLFVQRSAADCTQRRLNAAKAEGNLWCRTALRFRKRKALFTGLKEADLPKRPHNCLGADASFERLLNVLGQISGPRRNDRNATIAFGPDEVF